MQYIGIRGHRGSGKKSIATLLANTMDIILRTPQTYRYHERDSRAQFDDAYDEWVDCIMKNPNKIPRNLMNTNKVYIDAFGDIPRTFIQLLIDGSDECLIDNSLKDNVLINLKDFTKHNLSDLPAHTNVYTAQQLFEKQNSAISVITDDCYITIREFILYFGREVMQRFFGQNVWIKSLKQNTEFFENIFDDDNAYKLYYDIKTKSEVTYIKERGGYIIKIDRPENNIGGEYIDDISNDERVDYELIIDGDLKSIKERIWQLAWSITNK